MFKPSHLSSLQIFQLLRYASYICIGIGLAKLHIPQTEIGEYETFLMVSGMLSFFWVSGTINTMLAAFPKQDTENRRYLLFNTFLILSTGSLLAGIFLQVFSGNVLTFLNKNAEGNLIQLTEVYIILTCPSFINEYILYLEEKRTELLAYAILISVITITSVLLPLLLGFTLTHSLYGLIAVAILKNVYTISLLSRYASFAINLPLIFNNLKVSFPLMLSVFVSGSAEYIDGLIVKAKFNDMFFAIYRYGAKELPVLLIVANTFSAAMIPVVSKNLPDGLSEIRKGTSRLMNIFFPMSIALILVSPVLYRYLFSESFIYSALIFNIYLLLIIPRVLFPQSILTGLGQTRYLLFSSIIELSINFSVSVYLAGKIGLPGVAIGSFVAYVIDKLFLGAILYFKFRIRPGEFIKTKTFLIYIVLLFLSFGLSQYLSTTDFWNF